MACSVERPPSFVVLATDWTSPFLRGFSTKKEDWPKVRHVGHSREDGFGLDCVSRSDQIDFICIGAASVASVFDFRRVARVGIPRRCSWNIIYWILILDITALDILRHMWIAEPSITSGHFILFLVHQAQPFEPHTFDQER